MLVHINMIEVPGTSFEPKEAPGVAQFTRFLAAKTAPVFQAEAVEAPRTFSEVVAVTYRDSTGKPRHGGLFGFGPDGVTSIALKDLNGEVDTQEDPAHIAFGLVMMRGPLVFRQNGTDQKMELSIIDLHEGRLDDALPSCSMARTAVREAYLNSVLPRYQATGA